MASAAADTKPILVTGATGFIGAVVVRMLAARGRRVVGTDVVSPRWDAPPGSTVVLADVRDVLKHAPLMTACDGVIHCGGISGPMLAQDSPAELLDVNVRSTVQLLELTRALKLRRFVGCSSVSAYGDLGSDDPVSEQTPLRASSVYGTSKAAGDLVVQTYAARFGVSATSLRIGWVYGPGRRTDAILRPMIRAGLGGGAFALAQGADQRLQFVHVDDVAAALVAAFEAPALQQLAYNVNGSEILTLASIGDSIRRHLPGLRLTLGPGPLDDTDRQGPMLLDAAARDLGWRPRRSFEEGLVDYIEWLRTNDV